MLHTTTAERIHLYKTLRRLKASLFQVQTILATLNYDPNLELHHRTEVFRMSQFAQNWEELLNRTDATGELKQFQRREADRSRGAGFRTGGGGVCLTGLEVTK
jgi:hypothetical protein